MKLTFWRKSKVQPAPQEDSCDLSLAPHYPLLEISRCEIEKDFGRGPQYVLHVRINDEDKGKMANFHLRIGTHRGRPWAEITGVSPGNAADKIKKTVAVWCEVLGLRSKS